MVRIRLPIIRGSGSGHFYFTKEVPHNVHIHRARCQSRQEKAQEVTLPRLDECREHSPNRDSDPPGRGTTAIGAVPAPSHHLHIAPRRFTMAYGKSKMKKCGFV